MSTRAVVNSAWESSNAANSRRASMEQPAPTPTQQGARIGQHLSRLHKKAQEHLQQHDGGRQSVMSECDNPSSSPVASLSYGGASAGTGGRRASDPVRVLDRNFGVGARHRSGSYTGSQQQQYYSKSHYSSQQYQPPPGFNQAGFQSFPSSQQQSSSSSSQQQEQWQFNGFQQGFPPNYNYNFNAQQPVHPAAAQQQNWNHQHQWNNWNYYNNGQQQQASGETSSVSYQRTLEYVQQCQQQSWSANNPQ